jgi:hypothetical protein
MKVRWSRNSIRLRITPSELTGLLRGETVTEELALPGGGWSATLGACTGTTAIAMAQSELQLLLSPGDIEQLASPQNEGVYFGGDEQSPLRYFVEKDFPCAHPRATDAMEPPAETFEPTPEFIERSKPC